MDWILLIVIQSITFAVVVPSAQECRELGELNQRYWQHTGQQAQALCMRSFEV
jgi:hypothetical protein